MGLKSFANENFDETLPQVDIGPVRSTTDHNNNNNNKSQKFLHSHTNVCSCNRSLESIECVKSTNITKKPKKIDKLFFTPCLLVDNQFRKKEENTKLRLI